MDVDDENVFLRRITRCATSLERESGCMDVLMGYTGKTDGLTLVITWAIDCVLWQGIACIGWTSLA